MKKWNCDVKSCLGINLLRCFSSIARRVLQRFPILSRKDELRETIIIITIIIFIIIIHNIIPTSYFHKNHHQWKFRNLVIVLSRWAKQMHSYPFFIWQQWEPAFHDHHQSECSWPLVEHTFIGDLQLLLEMHFDPCFHHHHHCHHHYHHHRHHHHCHFHHYHH